LGSAHLPGFVQEGAVIVDKRSALLSGLDGG
jgi:hypothetical protein